MSMIEIGGTVPSPLNELFLPKIEGTGDVGDVGNGDGRDNMIIAGKSNDSAPEEVTANEVNGLSSTAERRIVPLNFKICILPAYREYTLSNQQQPFPYITEFMS